MKRYLLFLVILLLCVIQPVFAQVDNTDLESLSQSFKNFDYERVIRKSDRILQNKENLSSEQLISVYKYRALAHYSLTQMDLALRDFIDILNIDPGYNLDPMTTSPKIINYFNQIRASLQSEQKTIVEKSVQIDTLTQYIDNTRLVRNAAFRSVLLPGWGHLYARQKTKGLLLLAGSMVALGSSAYLIRDCNEKHDLYLSATEGRFISENYDKYNDAYKTRNLVLSVYAIYWLYTQTDLLFFTDLVPQQHQGFSMVPTFDHQGQALLTLTWHW